VHVRREEQPFTEHQVSRRDAAESSENLRGDVGWHLAPCQAALRCIRQRDGWIEVRSRNRSERKDQRNERGAGRDGVCEERDRGVSAGEPIAHDAGSDNGGEQQGRPERLSYSTPGHITPWV
jgi:hypothetical protein